MGFNKRGGRSGSTRKKAPQTLKQKMKRGKFAENVIEYVPENGRSPKPIVKPYLNYWFRMILSAGLWESTLEICSGAPSL